MPRKPPTDRWWPRKATRSLEEVWFEFGVQTQEPLVSTWYIGDAPRHALGACALSEEQETILGMCPSCAQWDPSIISNPVTVTLRRTARTGKPVTERMVKNLWIVHPFGSRVPLVHERLLEALESDIRESWLIGDAVFEDGTRMDSHRSVVDRAPLRPCVRRGFASGGHIGFEYCCPCPECGRLNEFPFGFRGSEYILEADARAHGPSTSIPFQYLPKRVVDRLDLHNRQRWPLARLTNLNVYTHAVDPFPEPMPRRWEELETGLAARGLTLPFPRFAVGDSDALPAWLARQVIRRGDQILRVVDDYQGDSECIGLDRGVFTLRLRALLEPRVREFIDGKSDNELIEAIEIHRRTFGDAGLPV